MLMNIYAFTMCALIAAGATYVLIRMHQANTKWDASFARRMSDLKDTLPKSDVFPVFLPVAQFPAAGINRQIRDYQAILYVQDGRLVIETIGSRQTAPYYTVYTLADGNISDARLNAQPETDFPGKGSYVLHTGKDTVFIIGNQLALATDVPEDARVIRPVADEERQQRVRQALMDQGITLIES
jgi:hypothetical protein